MVAFFFAFFFVAIFGLLNDVKLSLILRDVSEMPKKKFIVLAKFRNYDLNKDLITMKIYKVAKFLFAVAFISLFYSNAKISYQSAYASAEISKTEKQKAGKSNLAAMQAKYRGVTTLTAEFTQLQKNISLGTTKETNGRIFIKRPNFFRWETHQPEKDASILVSNGKKVWYYTPAYREGEHGQVLIRNAADVQSRLAIDLLDGHANIEKDFKIKTLDQSHYELTPLKPLGDIDHVELFLERPTNLVYKLVLFNLTGNQTELTLRSVTLGIKLSDSMFNFTPPKNTEEIH